MTHIALHVSDIEKCIAFYQKYCGMHIIHDRKDTDRVVWLSEKEREKRLVFVFIEGGKHKDMNQNDYSHFGFALQSASEVDVIAAMAKEDGILVWEPKEEAWPIGYFCGISDPEGHVIEFSFGQPLGPEE